MTTFLLLVFMAILIAFVVMKELHIEFSMTNAKTAKSPEPEDYRYFIKLLQPTKFYFVSNVEPEATTIPAGEYELNRIPAPRNHQGQDKYWWFLQEQEAGISPKELEALLAAGKAEWLQKPHRRHHHH